jgi:hypothetical protein
LLSVEKDG